MAWEPLLSEPPNCGHWRWAHANFGIPERGPTAPNVTVSLRCYAFPLRSPSRCGPFGRFFTSGGGRGGPDPPLVGAPDLSPPVEFRQIRNFYWERVRGRNYGYK